MLNIHLQSTLLELQTGLVLTCEQCYNFHLQPFATLQRNKKEKHINNNNYKTETLKLSKLEVSSNVCDQCENKWSMNGPVWLSPINDVQFVQKLLEFAEGESQFASIKKIRGILQGIIQEKDFQNSAYTYKLPKISKFLRLSMPALDKLQ